VITSSPPPTHNAVDHGYDRMPAAGDRAHRLLEHAPYFWPASFAFLRVVFEFGDVAPAGEGLVARAA